MISREKNQQKKKEKVKFKELLFQHIMVLRETPSRYTFKYIFDLNQNVKMSYCLLYPGISIRNCINCTCALDPIEESI